MSETTTETIAEAINRVLEDEWKEWITFDEAKAKSTEKVILVWKVSGIPINLNIHLTQKALDEKRISFRELRGKIKNNLPHQMVKDSISEINSVLRNANRRAIKEVLKDFKDWDQKTREMLFKILGDETAENFSMPVELPTSLKENSLQALQFLVEAKIDRLARI